MRGKHLAHPMCNVRCARYDEEYRGNRCVGSGSQGLGFPNDSFSQFGPKRQAINHLDATAQQLLQALRQANMVTQTIARLKVNQKINIAIQSQSPAQKRSKYGNLEYAMLLCQSHDLLALLLKVIKGVDCSYSHFLDSRVIR